MSEIQPQSARSLLEQIFLTPGETRLRAGWRLLLQTAILFIFATCLGIPLVIVLLILDPSFATSIPQVKPEYMLLGTILETFLITLSVFLAVRFLDKRPIESLGLQLNIQALYDIFAGIGITFVQMVERKSA